MTAGLRIALLCALLALLAGCANLGSRQQVLAAGSQVEVRSYQTRTYDTSDKTRVLRAVMSTLQDLRFVIDKADDVVGVVSATKLDGYALSMSVTVQPRGEQMVVRANAQYNLKAIEDPGPYQDFFAALNKGLFLDDNLLVERGGTQPAAAPQASAKGAVGAESVYEFYGEAEAEIDANEQDRNLWARALVEVEGDEQKRKARYIELRAAELYRQNGGRAAVAARVAPIVEKGSVIDKAGPAYLVSGSYSSRITYTKNSVNGIPRWYFGKNPGIQVDIVQDGNSISGTMSGDRSGQIEGTIDGNKITFEFFMKVPGGAGKEGKGTWILNDNLISLDGDWNLDYQGNSLAGTWNLYKSDSTPIATLEAPVSSATLNPLSPATPNVSGTYWSRISGPVISDFTKRHKKGRLELTQTGNRIKGSFGAHGGQIEGSIEGNKIVFDWYTQLNNGKGEWVIREDGWGLTGKWQHHNFSHSGEWNLTKYDSMPITKLDNTDSKSTSVNRSSPPLNLAGTYASFITSNSRWQFKKKYQRLEIKLSQNGKAISGFDEKFGTKIGGSIEGTSIAFYVEPGEAAGGYDIEGKWDLAPDGSSLDGFWKCRGCADDAAGKWKLIRIE